MEERESRTDRQTRTNRPKEGRIGMFLCVCLCVYMGLEAYMFLWGEAMSIIANSSLIGSLWYQCSLFNREP